MKIALVMYPISDYGGIINHLENLAFGLRELGHEVSFHILYYQSSFRNLILSDKDLLKRGWTYGAFCAINQYKGWNAVPGIHKLSYKGKKNLIKTREILSKYDLLIWEVPVPTKTNVNRGNFDWVKLYSACDKNIAIIHDGNLKRTPWIVQIGKSLTGLACVHEAAYNSAKILPIPRAMILNPQNLTGLEQVYDYSERETGFLSLQVFKAWKHVDDIVRSIPYMSKSFRKVVGGGGIEQRYMSSRNKVKGRYFCNRSYDPDLPEYLEHNETTIWDRALHYGMQYIGFVGEFKRDILLRQLRVLVDPSWSLTYTKQGAHFNRVIVEAIRQGTIPVATNIGMSDNIYGEGKVFNPKDNYIMIPYNSNPKEYAQIVEYASHLSNDEALSIIDRNYDLLDVFDRRKVAQDFVDLAMGKSCGFFKRRVKGKLDPDMVQRSRREMESFFKLRK